MRRAIVTVACAGAPFGLDLEVPVDADARGLSEAIFRAFRLHEGAALSEGDNDMVVEIFPPGRVLAPEETLARAGVWDGAWLVLRPAARVR